MKGKEIPIFQLLTATILAAMVTSVYQAQSDSNVQGFNNPTGLLYQNLALTFPALQPADNSQVSD